jgi:hypothetical protein
MERLFVVPRVFLIESCTLPHARMDYDCAFPELMNNEKSICYPDCSIDYNIFIFCMCIVNFYPDYGVSNV